jgi:signal peptidase I
MKKVIRYIVLIISLIAVVIAVKIYFIDSYRITSDNISDTVKKGDFVFVNKLKSWGNPGRNRLIIYKSPLMRDAVTPPLFIGRCVGLPGDVIQMGEDGFRVNGRLLNNAPMMQPMFRIRKNIKAHLFETMNILNIPLRDIKEDSLDIIIRLSLREKELLMQNLSQVVQIDMINRHSMGYEFPLPKKDNVIPINATTLMVCREAILNEAGQVAEINDNKLYINGVECSSFQFKNDYFWILSENEHKGIDSRYLGLVSGQHILGNIWCCWYSKDASRRLKIIK